jgi:hypothetical protein
VIVIDVEDQDTGAAILQIVANAWGRDVKEVSFLGCASPMGTAGHRHKEQGRED